jgi:hypothetical protein
VRKNVAVRFLRLLELPDHPMAICDCHRVVATVRNEKSKRGVACEIPGWSSVRSHLDDRKHCGCYAQ